MSINKILVHTQYEENYGHYEGNFHWKKKGGHTFQIEMDADLFFYTDPAEVFGKMLESQNTDLERFTYVDHEIVWQEPTLLGSQADYVAANSSLEEKEPNHIIAGVDFSDSLSKLNNLSVIETKSNL